MSLPIPVPDVGQMGMLCMSGVFAPYRRRKDAGHAECAQSMGYTSDSEENAEITRQDGTSCAVK